jgi:imidazolonepropionase-like amidohydrolase
MMHRNSRRAPALITVLLLLSACAPAAQPNAMSVRDDELRHDAGSLVALTGGTLIDGTGAAPRTGTVVIDDGRIACVGECPLENDVRVVDATGKYIIPGLVDAHVHYSQTGWTDGRPDALDLRERFPYDSTVAALKADPERFFRSYLCSGVTATFDVGGYPWTWDLRERAEQSTSAPHVAAAGPLITPSAPPQLLLPGTQQFIRMESDSLTRAAARFITRWGSDAVKVWMVVGPSSRDTAAWVRRLKIAAEEAHRAGTPLLVHATNLWAAKHALRQGAKLLVHSVEDQPVDEEFLRLAHEAGTFYNPTLTVREGYVELRERRFDPSDVALECVDPDTRRKAFLTDSIGGGRVDPEFNDRIAASYRIMVENLRRVHEAGIPVVTGSDAGNPLTLHGPAVLAEMEAMAAAGLSPMEVLVASTRSAARAMGRDDIGTLEEGKIADLVVLDRDPLQDITNVRSVKLVVRGGKVWTREELEYR